MKCKSNNIVFFFIKIVKILLINIFVFVALFELGSRIYLSLRRDAAFLDPSSVAMFYYPEMKSIMREPPTPKKWDVLLLGASVLNSGWGSVENELNAIFSESDTKVTIHNLSMPAHTTRDSLIKYQLLKDHKFDKVFLYHGINDLRMNNYPNHRYREDYSHIHWYRTVNLLPNHSELSYIATPFFAEHAWSKITKPNDDDQYEDSQYGDIIKSSQSLYNNIVKIADLASEKEEDLILATYAYHLPDDYNIDAFKSKSLPYSAHLLPVEAWGLSKNVKRGLSLHNDMISQIAATKEIFCVKFDKEIIGQATNFDDVCHLTSEGSSLFAELLAPHLLPQE